MGKFWAWTAFSIMFLLSIMLSYFYFFPTIPKEDELILIKGTIRRTAINDDGQIIYIKEFRNRFTDTYLSKKEFKEMSYNEDSVFIHIRKIDTVQLNRNKKIKLWSLRLNKETFYTSKKGN